MSVKRFNADLKAAASRASQGTLEAVKLVARGESDGEVVMTYSHHTLPSPIRIRALGQNLADYPEGTAFLLFTDDQDAPPAVIQALESSQNFCFGVKIVELALNISRNLTEELDDELSKAMSQHMVQQSDEDDDEDAAMTDAGDADEDDLDDYYDEDADMWDDAFEDDLRPGMDSRSTPVPSPNEWKALLRRIKQDLCLASAAGYKVGILEGLRSNSERNMLSISVCVKKLALSDEAMQAWDIKPTDYVVLLIRYTGPYRPLDRLVDLPAPSARTEFRIGKCSRYKPSPARAAAAFLVPKPTASANEAPTKQGATVPEGFTGDFQKLFISNSLDDFMRESLLSIVKLRERHQISWDEANERLIGAIGLGLSGHDSILTASSAVKTAVGSSFGASSIPQVANPYVARDHLTEGKATNRSFPLIAMQFAMRYFVRCTEFCLRCHRSVGGEFEALKPYVCSNPLCLFQYLSLGFGPNIEHEIVTQPFVVDLLVSFCYAGVQRGRGLYDLSLATGQQPPTLPIRELPVGLKLKVPNPAGGASTQGRITAELLPTYQSLKLTTGGDLQRLKINQWVAIRRGTPSAASSGKAEMPSTPSLIAAGPTATPVSVGITSHSLPELPPPLAVHARVVAVDFAYQTIDIDPDSLSSGTRPKNIPSQGQIEPRERFVDILGDTVDVEILPYEIDFDGLDDLNKGQAIMSLLDTLPPILDIRNELTKNPQKTLRGVHGLSPAAESILRWIVSSNRSCIFQISKDPHKLDTHSADAATGNADGGDQNTPAWSSSRVHEKIGGIDSLSVQFRFAQGAPDREQRFRNAVKQVAARKNLKHPTIFAWHGSALRNWHSIVRNGLDYSQTAHGRAYGHGVYFSPQYNTSMGYCTYNTDRLWPKSAMLIQTALSLNEIINAPDEFVSSTPHYVVAQPDWHQCRYLFVGVRPLATEQDRYNARQIVVKDSGAKVTGGTAPTVALLEEDPDRRILGPTNQPLQIPLAAFPSRRAPDPAPGTSSGQAQAGSMRDGKDDSASDSDVGSDNEDMEFLFAPEADDAAAETPLSPKASIETINAVAISASTKRPLTPAGLLDASGTDFRPGALDLTTLPRLQPPDQGTGMALKALSREVAKLQQVQSATPLRQLGWYIDFEQLSNLFQWIVELHSFDASLPLAADMRRAGVTSIVLEIRFSVDFPITPPFVRVMRPRFLPFQAGGGGHVTAGGAMCMELLTNSGWLPANSMESVIVQVRVAMTNIHPQPARLEPHGTLKSTGSPRDYGISEAIEAYERAARAHGWSVPPGLTASLRGTA